MPFGDQALDLLFQLERALVHGSKRRADEDHRQMAVFTDVVAVRTRGSSLGLIEALLKRAAYRLRGDRLWFVVVEQRVRRARDFPIVAR